MRVELFHCRGNLTVNPILYTLMMAKGRPLTKNRYLLRPWTTRCMSSIFFARPDVFNEIHVIGSDFSKIKSFFLFFSYVKQIDRPLTRLNILLHGLTLKRA